MSDQTHTAEESLEKPDPAGELLLLYEQDKEKFVKMLCTNYDLDE